MQALMNASPRVRILEPFTTVNDAKSVVEGYTRFLAQPWPAQLVHLAGHHKDFGHRIGEHPRLSPRFELYLRDGAKIDDILMRQYEFSTGDAAVAFLNVCSACANPGWGSGGLAEHLILNHNAVAVVASMCKIGDAGAAQFSAAFFEAVLPRPGCTGVSLGAAVMQARRAVRDAGLMVGLCYKLLGAHDVCLGDRVGGNVDGQERYAA
jgi:hypothetical protein